MIYDRRNNVTIEETITCFAEKLKKLARNIMYYTNVYTALVFDSRAPHVAGKLGGSKQGAGFKKL